MLSWPNPPRWLGVAALVTLLLAACGYRCGGEAPAVLQGRTNVAMGAFENPTVETWLEPSLRARVRDELASRALVTWTERGKADMTLGIQILRYSDLSTVKNEHEKTLKKAVTLRLEAKLLDAKNQTLVWRSGPFEVSWSYTDDSAEAQEQILLLAARTLADRLGHAF